jgi:IS1 family transposase
VRDVVDKLTESMKRFRNPIPQERYLFIAYDRQAHKFVLWNFPEARAEML